MSEYIWHYTSESTLIELLGKRDRSKVGYLYGTLYNFFNDSDEITFGYELIDKIIFDELDKILLEGLNQQNGDSEKFKIYTVVNDVLRKFINLGMKDCKYFLEKYSSEEREREIINILVEHISAISRKEMSDDYDVFVFCFSHAEDSLPQWRAYTPQDGGYALGFKTCELLDKIKDKNYFVVKKFDQSDIYVSFDNDDILFYGNCIYYDGSSEQKEGIYEVHLEITQRIRDYMANMSGNRFAESESSLSKLIVASLIKDKSFSDEKEVRLVLIKSIVHRNEIEFIAGKPRTKIRIENVLECVEKICISPHGDRERHKKVLEIIKAMNGEDYIVGYSNSTYNGK